MHIIVQQLVHRSRFLVEKRVQENGAATTPLISVIMGLGLLFVKHHRTRGCRIHH